MNTTIETTLNDTQVAQSRTDRHTTQKILCAEGFRPAPMERFLAYTPISLFTSYFARKEARYLTMRDRDKEKNMDVPITESVNRKTAALKAFSVVSPFAAYEVIHIIAQYLNR
jgi:hypothetical protein